MVPGAGAADPGEAAYKTPGFLPLEVAPDGSGNVWFSGQPTAGGTGQIGRLGGALPTGGGGGGGGGGTPSGGGPVTAATNPAVTRRPGDQRRDREGDRPDRPRRRR